jgi:hypothetical protein
MPCASSAAPTPRISVALDDNNSRASVVHTTAALDGASTEPVFYVFRMGDLPVTATCCVIPQTQP